jgi:glycosyltransferase involved in cell wall biosynthesis
MSKVAIITPTYKRDLKTLERSVRSVLWQGYTDFTHFVCHDGPWEDSEELAAFKEKYSSVVWMNTPERSNTYGASVRQHVLDQLDESFDYVVHFDDDNLLFPEFLEEHVKCLDSHPEVDFTICKILHNGPLPFHMGEAPKIISGIPPVFRNIDTLQVMVRVKAILACGWTQHEGMQGYCNDGYTYQRLGEMFRWEQVPKLLAIHL